MTVRSARARSHTRARRYGRRQFHFFYQKYLSEQFFVNYRLWGMLSSSRKKKDIFIRAKLCLWGPRARARARTRTRYGQRTYLWISIKLIWIFQFFFFKWKLVIFPFCSYVLHMILLYFNIRREPMNVLWNFVYKSKLFKLQSKLHFFLEII